MPPPNQKVTFQQARAARLAVAALFFTNGALFSNLIPRYPEIKDIFALSDSIYGLTIALFPLGAICAGPLAGAFIRRFSSARTACLGTVGIGVFLSIVGLIATWRASLGALPLARRQPEQHWPLPSTYCTPSCFSLAARSTP